MATCLHIDVNNVQVHDALERKLLQEELLKLLGRHTKVQTHIVDDHGATIGHPFHVLRFFGARYFQYFRDHVLLHRIEISSLALTRHPLETIPE